MHRTGLGCGGSHVEMGFGVSGGCTVAALEMMLEMSSQLSL